MMIGEDRPAAAVERSTAAPGKVRLAVENLTADDADGAEAVRGVSLAVRGGEIVGIAGVSGNGQSELVEVLAGQRDATGGRMLVEGESLHGQARRDAAPSSRAAARGAAAQRLRRAHERRREHGDPRFRPAADLVAASGCRAARCATAARALIARYRVKTPGPDAPIASLSGGNVQRAVLARELGGEVHILIAANPVFGLDFAAVADIHGQIVAARNRGAAVLLVSEDLDELLDLSDRLLVISEGQIVLETTDRRRRPHRDRPRDGGALSKRRRLGRAPARHVSLPVTTRRASFRALKQVVLDKVAAQDGIVGWTAPAAAILETLF